MSHWLIPANTKFYDVFAAFAQVKTYWPMNAKIVSGDIVYIYLATPYKQIGFVSEVLDTDYNPDRIIDKVRPFIKGNPNKDGPSKPFMKLGETRTFTIDEDNALRLENLKQNGLTGMLMGARKLENNPTLLAYIRRNSP